MDDVQIRGRVQITDLTDGAVAPDAKIRQSKIGESDSFDDNLDPTAASRSISLEDDLDFLRSQIKVVTGELSWTTPPVSSLNALESRVATLETTGVIAIIPPHANSHQAGGTDVLNVGGLLGELTNPQKVNVYFNGSSVGAQRTLNFIPGTGITMVATNNPSAARVDIQIMQAVALMLPSEVGSTKSEASPVGSVGPVKSVVRKVFADSPYTVIASDSTILADATDGPVDILLPAAANNAGRVLTIKKLDKKNVVTLSGVNNEPVEGRPSKNITTQYGFVAVQCDGTAWWIVS